MWNGCQDQPVVTANMKMMDGDGDSFKNAPDRDLLPDGDGQQAGKSQAPDQHYG